MNSGQREPEPCEQCENCQLGFPWLCENKSQK